MENVLFYRYKNVTQGDFFFEYNPPRPSAKFKNPMKNRVTQSVRLFVYKNRNANCLSFFEVSVFLDIKRSRNAKCHAFCIYINANLKLFIYNCVTLSVRLFVNKNVTKIGLPLE